MSDRPQNEYLRAKIMTASPEQLQTMLYDGAIRFAEQARQAMADKDVPTTHDRLLRAQRIVLELSTSLKVEVDPALCRKLASLYNYVYRLLVESNLGRDLAKLDEAISLLRYQRETWLLALENLRGNPAASASGAAATTPSATADAATAAPAAPTAAPAAPAARPARPLNTAPEAPPTGRILSIEG